MIATAVRGIDRLLRDEPDYQLLTRYKESEKAALKIRASQEFRSEDYALNENNIGILESRGPKMHF